MANEVFANNLEIACKAADGKSVACFPDVCFTPPSPPAGWIPIPYANTAYAKDTANASKTVFISGKPVMKKDVSYFKTSTGNEPAAGPQGIMTHVKKGKAYFTSWSMNVKIEGQNVDRHTDMTTHNHGSGPNTGPWMYADSAARNGACKQDIEKMDKACSKKDTQNKNDKEKTPAVKTKSKDKTKQGKNEPQQGKDNKNVYWKEEHCKGLGLKPYEVKKENLDEFTKDLKDKLNQIDIFDKAIDEVIQLADKKMKEKVAIMVTKAALKKPVQAAMAACGWFTFGLSTLAAGVWAGYDVYDGVTSYNELNEKLNQLKKAAEEAKKLEKTLKDIEDLQKNFDKDKATKMMADAQEKMAMLDGCMRARKCQLVSKSDSDSKAKTKNIGCCPGQTGHHLVPESYIKDSGNCKGYKGEEAATVCAEGTSHTKGGSHQRIHTKLNTAARRLADSSSDIKYDDAVDAAIESHRQTFPFSNCSEKCLKAQLMNDKKKSCAGEKNPNLKFKPIGIVERSEIDSR